MAQIELEGLTKRYPDGFEAVKDMDLAVADGEFMILIGPSGSGKSTVLRMIAGLEEITEGVLKIGGRRANELAPRERDIAMVFQSYALYPHMTVRENMGFALELGHEDAKDRDRKVTDAARILGLEEYLDRKPASLSGGQRQRVAMGRAIVANRWRSCWMSRCRTSTPSFVWRRAARSPASRSGSGRRPSTSPTTRPKR